MSILITPSCLDVMKSSPSRLRLMCKSARVAVAPRPALELPAPATR